MWAAMSFPYTSFGIVGNTKKNILETVPIKNVSFRRFLWELFICAATLRLKQVHQSYRK